MLRGQGGATAGGDRQVSEVLWPAVLSETVRSDLVTKPASGSEGREGGETLDIDLWLICMDVHAPTYPNR